jgi:phosphopentomutase
MATPMPGRITLVNRRFFLLVLDGCGVGALPDAHEYGETDPDSDTLSHVAAFVGGLYLPNLQKIGLGNVTTLAGVAPDPNALSRWGRLMERSRGKDTVTGHWEMMGIVTDPAFPTYPSGFPTDVLSAFEHAIGCKTLGNFPASAPRF